MASIPVPRKDVFSVTDGDGSHETILVNHLVPTEQIGSVGKVVDVAVSRLVIRRFRGGVQEDQAARIFTNRDRFFDGPRRLHIPCKFEHAASGRNATGFEAKIQS